MCFKEAMSWMTNLEKISLSFVICSKPLSVETIIVYFHVFNPTPLLMFLCDRKLFFQGFLQFESNQKHNCKIP